MSLFKKIIIIFIIFLFHACNSKIAHEFSGSTMGTTYLVKFILDKKIPFDITLLKNDIDSLLNEINYSLSTYVKDSEINEFNSYVGDEGFLASNMLSELIEKSIYYHGISNGDFDVTVGPIVREWGFSTSYNFEMAPDSSIIVELLNHIGTDKIYCEDNYIYKRDPLVEIDLNAIAKGWAVDKISNYLNLHGLRNHLIEIGGEIFVSGKNIYGNEWEIGIRSPDISHIKGNKDIFHVMSLTDMAVATSGTYENYFEYNDIIYSHIIDPINGFPVEQEIYSATVVSRECVAADAVATAVMVKGAVLGMEWIESLENIEALFIVKDTSGTYMSLQSQGFSDF
tara:strand:+ start:1134 stop:2153 length:1020 start_codon:yes stop_codon:yes gene_type:complete